MLVIRWSQDVLWLLCVLWSAGKIDQNCTSFLSSNCCQNMPNHRSLSPILLVSVEILPRKVVVCRDFILRAVATFWVMSLVGIYPGRASLMLQKMDLITGTWNCTQTLHFYICNDLICMFGYPEKILALDHFGYIASPTCAWHKGHGSCYQFIYDINRVNLCKPYFKC